MSALKEDAEVRRMVDATDQLTAPGGMFEITDEVVLGEDMKVFRNRPRSLSDLLEVGRKFGDREHLVFDDGQRLTFGEFPEVVSSVASGLREDYGIGKGDRVAIYAANCSEWLLTFWACAVLGAQAVAMNGWWTESEARLALEATEPSLLVVDEKRGQRLGDSGGIPTVVIESEFAALRVRAGEATLEPVAIAEDDPVLILFTSGSTGRPKSAVLSHRIVIAFCMTQMFIGARARLLSPAPAQPGFVPVMLAIFPLFHISGLLATAISSQLSGQKSVWPMGRFDAGRAIALTHQEGINLWVGGSTHIVRLLDHPDSTTLGPSQLRGVGVGGSASTPELIRRIEERFPHLANTVSSGYGSTESGGMVSSAPNFMLRFAPDCVGLPHPLVAVKIIDDEDQEVPEGVEGNIIVRSPMVMLEYWRNPEANGEAFVSGRWLRTGDFGRMEDGLLFLASRRRDLIIRGGENIYPIEIENCLEAFPGVQEAAVVGIDDHTYGQVVHAVVVPEASTTLDADELTSHCMARLAAYKVPSTIEIVTGALPRTATGKVIKQDLVKGDDRVSHFVEE